MLLLCRAGVGICPLGREGHGDCHMCHTGRILLRHELLAIERIFDVERNPAGSGYQFISLTVVDIELVTTFGYLDAICRAVVERRVVVHHHGLLDGLPAIRKRDGIDTIGAYA